MATLPQTPPTSRTTVPRTIALAGNPNAGKTTLFNALTGLRQKVGNYPGVTVEKKEGRCRLPNNTELVVLDLPGTYSLSPKSPDEEIARDVLLGLRSDTEVPDAIVVVIDASNLERNLYLATQVLDLGLPTIVALNMTDVAAANKKPVKAAELQEELGAPVIELVALRGEGLDDLREALTKAVPVPQPPRIALPPKVEVARQHVEDALRPRLESTESMLAAEGVALRLLCGNVEPENVGAVFGAPVETALTEARESAGISAAALGGAEAGARYTMLGEVVKRAIDHSSRELSQSFSDKADTILTHKFWGLLIFAAITLLVFQTIFSWASFPMDFIDGMTSNLKDFVAGRMAEGSLRDLIVEGIIGGVGAVVIFLPQILLLFFFIGLLEDSGYMARAAFLMDRMMGRVGLHGRAFIPLISSFACAIPGIMATRSISSRRDRMTTILIAPLMSCSARLPVYYLMLLTFVPERKVLGPIGIQAAIMFSLYVLGVLVAMAMAWVFKKTLFKGPTAPLMLELPPYKVPSWRNVLVTMWERAVQFLQRAGTVILAISVVMWFMLSYPKLTPAEREAPPPPITVIAADGTSQTAPAAPESEEDKEKRLAGLQLDQSYAGRLGHVVEPLIKPLGFNWKIGIGLIGAMSAREVFVSTMGTVYSVGTEEDETSIPLREAIHHDRWPDGRPVWNTAVAMALLVYFVLAMQCLSTLAVVRRETNSWTWPLFMQVYMTALAWIAAFIVYRIFGGS